MTGRMDIAFMVGGFEVFLKMLFYFLHERGWGKIRWGKQEIQPLVIWITGLFGAGKTSVAKKVAEELKKLGLKHEHLDGETMRDLLPDTGFSKHEVDEHIKHVGLLASRLENVGVFVVASFISPYQKDRDRARKLNPAGEYIEVFVKASVEICEYRDPKGLYKKAREGIIKEFTGISAPYEEPENHEVEVDTDKLSVEESADKIWDYLVSTKILQ
jgi:adenylylsulfate kinase